MGSSFTPDTVLMRWATEVGHEIIRLLWINGYTLQHSNNNTASLSFTAAVTSNALNLYSQIMQYTCITIHNTTVSPVADLGISFGGSQMTKADKSPPQAKNFFW